MDLVGLSGFQSVSQGLNELSGSQESPRSLAQFHTSPSNKSVVLDLSRSGGDSPMVQNDRYRVQRYKQKPPTPLHGTQVEDIVPSLLRPIYRVQSKVFPLKSVSYEDKIVLARVQRRGTKGFMIGSVVCFLLAIQPVLVRKPSHVFQKLSMKLQLSCSRYGLFQSSQLGSFEGGMYVQKRFVPHRGFRSFLCAVASGVSIFILPKSMYLPLAQFLFVRATEAVLRYSVSQNWQPSIPCGENIVFALSTFTLVYGWLNQPRTVSASYNKFLTNHIGVRSGCVHTVAVCHDKTNSHIPADIREAKKWGYPLISLKSGQEETPFTGIQSPAALYSTNQYLKRTGQAIITDNSNRHDIQCQAQHPGYASCSRGNLHQLPYIIKSCLKTYAPVHILPLLLFRFKHLFTQPRETLTKMIVGTVRSATFLSSLLYFTFYLTCFYRNALLQFPFSQASIHKVLENGGMNYTLGETILGSGVSSAVFPFTASISAFFSLYLETPGRRVELTLYLASQALQTALNLLQTWGVVQKIDTYAPLVFILSYAVIMATYVMDPMLMRPSNFSLLHFLYGSGGRSLHFPNTRDEVEKANQWLRQISAWESVSKDTTLVKHRKPVRKNDKKQPNNPSLPPLPKRSSLNKSVSTTLFGDLKKNASKFGLEKYLSEEGSK